MTLWEVDVTMPEYHDPTLHVGAGPCVMVIFGASGDLTKRKLIPAVLNLARDGLMNKDFAIVGVAIDDLDTDQFRERISKDLDDIDPHAKADNPNWPWLLERMYYLKGEFLSTETYSRLRDLVDTLNDKHQTQGNVFFYLATAPIFFGPIVKHLGEAGLVLESAGTWRRVIIEKPFGHDLASARDLNTEIRQIISEKQTYRIDHYLGKETVQNIIVLRFGNGIFEPIWNRRYIDHVQITAAESLGVEHRGGYYDKAGAMRDMVPNHMMQLLTLIAMEPPISFDADAVRDEQVKLLRAVQPLSHAEVATHAVRGQYGAGGMDGKFLPEYRAEEGVSPDSRTETYVAMKLHVDNWRWADVPFYLRTGKRMARRMTEIVIQFKRPPFVLFRHTPIENLLPNQLVLTIQPNEGLSFRFGAKVPGTIMNLGSVKMDFCYADYFGEHPSTGYERLIYDCMIGDATLFQRADMVELGWNVIQPLIDAWKVAPKHFPNYPAGSWGPPEAVALMARDSREWREFQE
jgi:glucose-6-phosphate 1-dehydrogenase